MSSYRRFLIVLPAVFTLHLAIVSQAGSAEPAAVEHLDGQVAKQVLAIQESDENLLRPDAWRPWQSGFDRDGQSFVCDNGSQRQVQRGASQTVVLNQTRPEPIIAVAWSKAEGVTGTPDSDYALYLDLVYADGTSLWGQTAPFAVGHARLAAAASDRVPGTARAVAGRPFAASQSRRQGMVPRPGAA